MPENHYGEGWILVGISAQNSMLVRGGDKPVAIHVRHDDSGDLRELIADANRGVEAKQSEKQNGK